MFAEVNPFAGVKTSENGYATVFELVIWMPYFAAAVPTATWPKLCETEVKVRFGDAAVTVRVALPAVAGAL